MRKACNVIPSGETADCIRKAVSEYRFKARDNQREYSDLVAQQTSSLWTAIMGMAALIGMILSAIGVALVWRTFRETKASNQIAQRAFDYQVRPWIKVNQSIRQPIFSEANIFVTLEVKCTNAGSSPANRVSILAFILDGDWPTERILNHLPSFFSEEKGEWHERTIFPNDLWERKIATECKNIIGTHQMACIVIAARYSSPTDHTKFYYTANVHDFINSLTGERDVLSNLATAHVKIAERESFPSHAD